MLSTKKETSSLCQRDMASERQICVCAGSQKGRTHYGCEGKTFTECDAWIRTFRFVVVVVGFYIFYSLIRKELEWLETILNSWENLLEEEIGGTPTKDVHAYVTVFYFPAPWAATFRLRGFNLVYALFLCDHTSIPPAVRPPLLRQMDIGSLTCAQISVLAVHTNGGGSGTNKSAQELSRRDRKNCRSPWPARESNPGITIPRL